MQNYKFSRTFARCGFVGHPCNLMTIKTPLQGENPRPDFRCKQEPKLAIQPIEHPKSSCFTTLNIINIIKLIHKKD